MPHIEHSELIIIPVTANRHYGLGKKHALCHIITVVIDKVHIVFFTLSGDVLTRLQAITIKGQAVSLR